MTPPDSALRACSVRRPRRCAPRRGHPGSPGGWVAGAVGRGGFSDCSRELVHQFVAVGVPRSFQVVGFAEDPAVGDRGGAALSAGLDVVHLELDRGAADGAVVGGPLAAPLIALHDLPLHLGGDRGLPLLLLGDEEAEAGDDHLLVGGVGLDVGLAGPGRFQELDELPGDGEVHPAQGGGHRLHLGSWWWWRRRGWRQSPHPGRFEFTWVNFRVRGADLGVRDDRSLRHELPGAELRGQFQGFLLGEAEEAGQDLLDVLLRQDPRHDDHGREAETPIAERLDDLREAVHEPCGHAPVVGGAAGELPATVQVIEHVGGQRGFEWVISGHRSRGTPLAEGVRGVGGRAQVVPDSMTLQ